MTIETVEQMKEREAFEAWVHDYGLRYEPNYSTDTEKDCLAAWLARAAQPVRVSRETLLDAFNIYDGPVELHVTYNVERLRALGIEVIDATPNAGASPPSCREQRPDETSKGRAA